MKSLHVGPSLCLLGALFFGGCEDDDAPASATPAAAGNGGSSSGAGGGDTAGQGGSNAGTAGSSAGGSAGTAGSSAGGQVMEIAIREVVDAENWAKLFPQLSTLAAKQPGYITSREFLSFYSIAPDPNPTNPIRLGLGQWASLADYQQTFVALANEPLIPEYLATVKGLANPVVKPFQANESINVAGIIGPGQVLEVAVRDLSKVEDREGFFAAKEAFIKVLTSAPGVVREYEWVSAVPGEDFYVGMTQYESKDAFLAVASDPAISQGEAAATFFGKFPPMVAQITMEAP